MKKELYTFNFALIEDNKIKLDYSFDGNNIIKYFNTPQELLEFEDLVKITDPQDLVDYFVLEFNKIKNID